MIGSGILKGMVVTAKNLVGSFHGTERYVTEEYPEVKPKLPENFRNFPFLVHDGDTPDQAIDQLRCVACQICEKECPPACIYIEKSTDKKPDATGKMQFYPAVFDIDVSVCMSCQICVEVCPFEAIKMDHDYEIATGDRFMDLILNREKLAKPNTYYHQIHPTEAAEVDARLNEAKEKAEARAKAAAAAAAAKARAEAAKKKAAPKPDSSDTEKEGDKQA